MSETSHHTSATAEQLRMLCKAVEKALGVEQLARSNFDTLQTQIFNRLHIHISATTLKRVWGYVATDSEPRDRTLDTLAQFVGYNSFEHFCQYRQDDTEASTPVLSRHINVKNDLEKGDTITLFWNPGRVCKVRFLGDDRFIVEESENTRLTKGATFLCSLFIEGEPLFINHLELNGQPPVAYACGKKGGIRYQLRREKPPKPPRGM